MLALGPTTRMQHGFCDCLLIYSYFQLREVFSSLPILKLCLVVVTGHKACKSAALLGQCHLLPSGTPWLVILTLLFLSFDLA